MGRRALGRVDRNVNLDQHFQVIDKYDEPLDIERWLDGSGPIELEIGSGKGLFLRTASVARPEHRFIGIEIAGKYARYAAYGLARRGIANAFVIKADAKRVVTEMMSAESVHAVHVYFPDPWWKARHRKRRMMTADFVPQFERILEPNGKLHFWTDVKEYFDETLPILHEHTNLDGPIDVAETAPEHDLDYRTHFERRMRQHDHPVYRAEYRKGG